MSREHNVMAGQAGGRLVICAKIKDRGTITSHYASVDEMLGEHKSYGRTIEWYRIGKGETIKLN